MGLLSAVKRQVAEMFDKRGEIRATAHARGVRPIIDRAQSLVWGEKRADELRTFNPDVEISVEEQWLDIGTVAATSSTVLSLAGVFISPIFGVLSIPGLLIGSAPVYKSAYESLREEKKITNHLLASVVQTVLLVNGQIVLGNLTPLAYFSSRNLNVMARKRFETSMTGALTTQHDQFVTVVQEPIGQEDEIVEHKSILELMQNDVVLIRAGEMVPIDGYIVRGGGTIDERVLTGEAQPIEKGEGDKVFAATVVLSGKFFVRVASSGEETIIAQIEEILNTTFYHVSERELWAQQFTNRLALPTLVTSAAALPFVGLPASLGLIDTNPLYRLSIAGNSSLLNFLNISSVENILIKDGRVLEILQQVDTVIFDKTGTLTEDTLQIGRIYTTAAYSEPDVLMYAAMAEQHQSHPIAHAIMQAASESGLAVSEVDDVSYKLGLGLELHWHGQTILVGSPRFVTATGVVIPSEMSSILAQNHVEVISLICVVVDDTFAGMIELQAVMRREAATLIDTLKAHKQIDKLMIVSGDHEAPTKRLAEALGVDDYWAGTLPEDKAKLIDRLQEAGRTVCFVGDGLNDSVALKQADVSISLRNATTLATSTAQVILLDDNLANIVTMFELADRFDKNQKMAMAVVLGSSAVCLAGVLFWQIGLAQTVLVTTSGFGAGLVVSFKPWFAYRQQINAGDQVVDDYIEIVEA